jgi:hypothetical protein
MCNECLQSSSWYHLKNSPKNNHAFGIQRAEVRLLLGGSGGLGDTVLGLGHEQLHVARAAHVWANTTMGTEGAATHAGGLVDLDVLDDHLGGVKTLLDGVGLSVLEEAHQSSDGLTRPATLGLTPLLSLGGAANLAVVALEGDATGLGEDLAVQLLGLAEGHALDDVGSLEGVLEVAAEVADLRLGALGGHLGLAGVVDHCWLLRCIPDINKNK